MQKTTFKQWDLDRLDATFGLKQVFECQLLTEWENTHAEVADHEKQHLFDLQRLLQIGGDDWNEVELENKFISPLIMLTKIDNLKFSYFLERELKFVVGDYELSGIVDGVIATGFRNPQLPFFCLHEYKKAVDNEGHPNAQVLVAMLVAREMNKNQKPIYGLFIIGSIWQFVLLNGNEYCISQKYDTAKQTDVLRVFRMMRALREIIETKLL